MIPSAVRRILVRVRRDESTSRLRIVHVLASRAWLQVCRVDAWRVVAPMPDVDLTWVGCLVDDFHDEPVWKHELPVHFEPSVTLEAGCSGPLDTP